MKIILTISTLFLMSGCSMQDLAAAGKKYRENRHKSATTLIVLNNEYKLKKGQEIVCVAEDLSYDAQSYCYNKKNTIRFYTTFRKINSNYKIIHQRKISTNRLNGQLLPNNKIAHLEMWAIKK